MPGYVSLGAAIKAQDSGSYSSGVSYGRRVAMQILAVPDVSLWIPFALCCISAIYWYSTRRHGYWKSRGVPGPSPWPFVGNAAKIFTSGLIQHDLDYITQYGPVVGTYEGTAPSLLVADPDMLRQILVKEFPNFPNRRSSAVNQRVLRRILPRLMGGHWKHVRSQLTPSFSGSKLKMMVPEINRCARVLVQNLSSVQSSDIPIKEYTGTFTMDAIASTAFGLQLDSLRDKDNEFVRHARSVFNISVSGVKVVLLIFLPFLHNLMHRLNIGMFDTSASDFFTDIVRQTMEKRQTDNMHQTDFLQLMMDLRVDDIPEHTPPADHIVHGYNGLWSTQGLTEEEILAQSFIFFLAGYETTASTLAMLLHALATNPPCQQTLWAEIHEATADMDVVDYDTVMRLPYLDQCISEALRMYPPALRINRVCSQDTEVGAMVIQRGTLVNIPVYYLHHNPTWWPQPEQFIPTRFSPAEKHGHPPFAYLPFGQGPRACIGTRLALLEIKVAMVHVMKSFHILTCPSTQNPVHFKKQFLMVPEKPVTLCLRPRRLTEHTSA